MALTPNFLTIQLYTAIQNLTVQDNSTGSDGTLTSRQVYLQKSDGTYLVPAGNSTNFIVWPILATSIDIPVLDKDYALDITVTWMAGSTVVYTKTILSPFLAYSNLFLRQLTQSQASDPLLISNKNFWASKIKLRTLVDDVTQAVAALNDQTVASFAINECKKLTDNLLMFS